jgi:hypothetical protein
MYSQSKRASDEFKVKIIFPNFLRLMFKDRSGV